jgi:hypothetical protein
MMMLPLLLKKKISARSLSLSSSSSFSLSVYPS